MRRPYLVNLQIIKSDNQIAIRAAITDSYTPLGNKNRLSDSEQVLATTPLQSIALISRDEFRIKMVGMDNKQNEIFIREYDSDSFGNFDLKIPATINNASITKLQIFEVSYRPGVQLLLGSFIPLTINSPKKIIISDFDKTLCDTKFSTPKEMIDSLRKPLNAFPTIEDSVKLFKQHTDTGFQPFILSASPHFYETAIRDWLYQNQIYGGNIFLKDYRNILSFTQGVLTPKDMKKQGFYKLNQLVDILLMTGIPNHLVLMGDGFESDIFIYSTLSAILKDKTDPWKIWNMIKKESEFKLTTKQTSQFLSKFYQLGELRKRMNANNDEFVMDIHIRCTQHDYDKLKIKNYPLKFVQNNRDLIHYYIA